MAIKVPIYRKEKKDGLWSFKCVCCETEHIIPDKECDELVWKWSKNLEGFVNLLIDTYDEQEKKKSS